MRTLWTVAALGVLTCATACDEEPVCTLVGPFSGLDLTVALEEPASVDRVRIDWSDPDEGMAFIEVQCYPGASGGIDCDRVVEMHPRLDAEPYLSALDEGTGFQISLSFEYPEAVAATAVDDADEIAFESQSDGLVYDQYSQPNGARCDGKDYPFTSTRIDL